MFKEEAYYVYDKELDKLLKISIKKAANLLVSYYIKEQERFLIKNKEAICTAFLVKYDEETKCFETSEIT